MRGNICIDGFRKRHFLPCLFFSCIYLHYALYVLHYISALHSLSHADVRYVIFVMTVHFRVFGICIFSVILYIQLNIFVIVNL